MNTPVSESRDTDRQRSVTVLLLADMIHKARIPSCNHRTRIICFSIRLSRHIHLFEKHWVPRMSASTTAEVGDPGQGRTARYERNEHPGWRCLAALSTSGHWYKDTSLPPKVKAGSSHKMTLGV